MKLTIAFFGILFFVATRTAMAQTVPYDSLAVDSLITATASIVNPNDIKGPPDSKEITLGSSDFLAAMFAAGTQVVTFQKGAAMHVYWQRLSTDSSGADIQFMYFDESLTPLRFGPTVRVMETGPLYVSKETTITVPDTGYNALQITIGADTGESTCSLDAIELIQSGVAAVSEPLASQGAILASYPNPFEHSSRVAVHIDAPTSGRGELLISDALGRDVERVPIGELREGGQDVSLALDRAGIFFARLLIEGAPIGPPLQLVAE